MTRKQAEKKGLRFTVEGAVEPSSKSIPWAADTTIDGHLVSFQGKSEEQVIAAFERHLNLLAPGQGPA